MSEINKENYLQKIAEIAKNKTIISCTTGAKWQEEKMYSDEDLKKCWDASSAYAIVSHKDFKQTHLNFNEWIKELKKMK